MTDLWQEALNNLFVTEGVKETAKVAIGWLLKSIPGKFGQKLLESGKEDEVVRQLLDGFAQYQQRFEDRHGQLKPLGRSKPLPLESVYIAAKCLDPEQLRAFIALSDQENLFRDQGRRQKYDDSKNKPQDALELANREKFLMVLGAPGAGKSTFLRKIGLEALKGKESGYRHECYPILLDLREAGAGKLDIA